MRPIALARVRLNGTGHNICGVTAQTFVAAQGATRGDQTQGVVDHMTLLDEGVVLFEREGKHPELVPLFAVATMMPVENLAAEKLGGEYLAQREDRVAEYNAKRAKEAAEKNERDVALSTDAVAVLAVESKTEEVKRKPGRPRMFSK